MNKTDPSDGRSAQPFWLNRNRKPRQMISRVMIYGILVAAYAAIPSFLRAQNQLRFLTDVPPGIHAALTLVLGWLLVFRTNTSYARWWEARTLWGGLVNTIRNLSLKFVDLIDVPEQDRREIQQVLNAFAGTLKDHLRDGASLEDSELFESANSAHQHLPSFLVSKIYDKVRDWKNAAKLMATI